MIMDTEMDTEMDTDADADVYRGLAWREQAGDSGEWAEKGSGWSESEGGRGLSGLVEIADAGWGIGDTPLEAAARRLAAALEGRSLLEAELQQLLAERLPALAPAWRSAVQHAHLQGRVIVNDMFKGFDHQQLAVDKIARGQSGKYA
ncbi:hypothetical protein ACQ4N8_17790, partial [Paenibacillus macerans]